MKNGMVKESGGQYWYKNDMLHREEREENGRVLPAVEKMDGSKGWYKDGQLHREDRDENGLVLPAVERANGSRLWYKGGKRHRVCGPAIIDSKGGKRWFIEGVEVKKEEHPWWIAQNEKRSLEKEVVNENVKEECCKLEQCAGGGGSDVSDEKEKTVKTKKGLRI